MEAKLVGWLLSVAAVLFLLFGCYKYGRYVERLEQTKQNDAAVIKQQVEHAKDLEAFADRLRLSGDQHDKDQTVTNDLSRKLLGLRRIHIPTCDVPTPSQAGSGESGSAGILSNRVDESFASLQARADELFLRADQLDADARRLNGELP